MADKRITASDYTGVIKTGDLALLLGVGERWIQRLTKEGTLHKLEGRAGLYPMPDVVHEYAKALGDSAKGYKIRTEDEKSLEVRKAEAEVALKEAKAKKARVELKEYEGKFHRADDVRKIVLELVFFVRSWAMAMPGRLAAICEGKSAAEISDEIRRECNHMLNTLATHEYDSSKYEQLVKEREGFSGTIDSEYEDTDDYDF